MIAPAEAAQLDQSTRPDLIEIVYCRGGHPLVPSVARFAGMRYGTRHDYTPYAPVWFLDIRWKNYNWREVMRKVRAWRPMMALVPDYEFPHQRDQLLRQIDDLRPFVPHICVCPKFDGAIRDIPADCVLAISVPTDYAGYLPRADEIEGRRLHLLGGTPDQQVYLIRHRYPQSRVISVDGNKFAMKAAHGQYWHHRYAAWVQTPRHRYSSLALELASAWHIVRYLRDPKSYIRMSGPVQKCLDVKANRLFTAGGE
jgi:hypothetical protein